MSITKGYTVGRVASGKVVLLERGDESIQVVVDVKDFAPVKKGDIVKVTWIGEIGGDSSYTVKVKDTEAARQKAQKMLDQSKLRRAPQ